MEPFIIATHNVKKLAELERILAPLGISVQTAAQAGYSLPEVDETGTTFAENARLKAESAMRATGRPAVADDSGLVVDALGGAPGVYSARYAGRTPATATGTKNCCENWPMCRTTGGRRGLYRRCAACSRTARPST